MSETFKKDELQIIRQGVTYTHEMTTKIIEHIMMLSRVMFENYPMATRLPKIHELPNTFIFRSALCAFILAKRWISVGGAQRTKQEKLRNDIIDVNFAAYATYFDGFLTADKKIEEIYREASWLLKNVFVIP